MRIAVRRTVYASVLVALLFVGVAYAQEAEEPRDILIRNATLIDPAGTAGPRRLPVRVQGK